MDTRTGSWTPQHRPPRWLLRRSGAEQVVGDAERGPIALDLRGIHPFTDCRGGLNQQGAQLSYVIRRASLVADPSYEVETLLEPGDPNGLRTGPCAPLRWRCRARPRRAARPPVRPVGPERVRRHGWDSSRSSLRTGRSVPGRALSCCACVPAQSSSRKLSIAWRDFSWLAPPWARASPSMARKGIPARMKAARTTGTEPSPWRQPQ
jgi:hypothetical protein